MKLKIGNVIFWNVIFLPEKKENIFFFQSEAKLFFKKKRIEIYIWFGGEWGWGREIATERAFLNKNERPIFARKRTEK